MPYFKNNDTNILFIHIPKTGGTSLEIYFSLKFNILLDVNALYSFLIDNNDVLINSSLQHITYKEMVKYNDFFNIDFNNIKIITIVRNPYERIISDLFHFGLININDSKEQVYEIIKDYLYASNYDNHNLPQYVFITNDDLQLIDNIHILKTETLTCDMKKMGFDDFDRYDNTNSANTNSTNTNSADTNSTNTNEKVNYYNYINNKSFKIINEFYHHDFFLFNYTKICDPTILNNKRLKIVAHWKK